MTQPPDEEAALAAAPRPPEPSKPRRFWTTTGFQTAVFASYFLLIYGLLFYHRIYVAPDQLLVLLSVVLCFWLRRRAVGLVRDWLPFVFLILAYQALRGTALAFGFPIHETDIIALERWLFGTVPTVALQRLFHTPGVWRWYDSVALFFHLSHFFFPFSFAIALRIYDREAFVHFSTALVLLSFLGYFTYVVFPLVPPWMASQHGTLEPINRVLFPGILHLFPVTLVWFFNPNAMAAMPSLHAAWPTLVCLVAVRLWGRWALPVALWPIMVSLSLVYTGEHYVVDIL
ncbi:MAG: phosphatase PAP2 family protein, partial [Nitrospinota bacterium]